jgi:hypothetical protein
MSSQEAEDCLTSKGLSLDFATSVWIDSKLYSNSDSIPSDQTKTALLGMERSLIV